MPLVEVETAIAQFAVVKVRFFRPLIRQFADPRHILALALALHDPFQQGFCHRWMPVQEIIELFLQKIPHKGAQANAPGRHRLRPQLRLGLRFKHRLLHPNAHRCHHRRAYIGGIEILFIEFPYCAHQSLTKSGQMGPPLGSELPVHKRIILFPVLLPMHKSHFQIGALQVNNGVSQTIGVGLTLQQIQQAVLRQIFLVVEHQCQASIQISIIPDLLLHKLVYEAVVAENLVLRHKGYQSAVAVFCRQFV